MAKFLFEASYGPEGVRALVREGAAQRHATLQETVTKLGGQVEALYFAFGDVDAYIIVDLPDNVTANALSLAVNQSGAVRIKTTVLLSSKELDAAIAHEVLYRAPEQ
jgi:uncharacterized protein with GYD domain